MTYLVEFETRHPLETEMDDLVLLVEKWASENNVELYFNSYVLGYIWVDDGFYHEFKHIERWHNTIYWKTIDKETAAYVSLVWNGRGLE